MYSNDRFRVQAASKAVFPGHARRAKERQEYMADSIRDMLKNNNFQGRRIVTMVPNDALKYKSFRLPQMPEDELHQVVQFEAEERFAFKESDAEFRFLHAGQIRQGQESREEIIAMGCLGGILREQLNLFSQLGLVCEGMEVAPTAIARCLQIANKSPHDSEEAQVLVDIGYQASRIIISQGGKIIFIKSISVGGSKFCELIAKKLNLSSQEASQLRQEILHFYAYPESQENDKLHTEILDSAIEATRSAVEQLGKEIGLCLRYFSVTFKGIRPEELVCVGGESYDPRLLQSISETTGLNSVKGAPLKQIATDGIFSGADRKSGLLEWATVTGLALREMAEETLEKVAS